MPFYLISIQLYNGKEIKGIKEAVNYNIDIMFRQFSKDAVLYFKSNQIKKFDCVMISRQSEIYKAWIKKKQLKKGMLDNYTTFMEEGPTIITESKDNRKNYDASVPKWSDHNRKLT